MTFASILGLICLALFGGVIAAGALNAKKLISWENRVLVSLADAVRNYRMSIEEEQRLLAEFHAAPMPSAQATKTAAAQKNRAA